MKTSIQRLPGSKIELRAEIPFEEFEKFLEKATFDLGKDLEIEGFRKGKAPKEMIEKVVGLERILREGANLAIREVYPQLILENKIEPLGQPEVEILKLAPVNPFEFKVIFWVLPEIKLPDYKNLISSIKRKEIVLTPEEIEKLRREKERIEKERLRQEILEKIAQESEMEIPEILIEEEKKRLFEEAKRQIPLILQISFEDYLKKIGKTEKEFLDSFLAEAEKRVKNFLVLREIGKREKILVQEEEIEKEMEKILKDYPASDPLDRERLREYTKSVIENEKIFQFLENFLS
jgi:FKBP-type peptidyl-prolyl cis-trans isomerase (trigger factor)